MILTHLHYNIWYTFINIEVKVPRKRKLDNSNLDENTERKKEQKQQLQLPQAAVLPPPTPLEVAAAAYNASPIQLQGNNIVFADRPLYRVDVTMPSTIDGNIGLNVQTNHVFARPQINSICNSSGKPIELTIASTDTASFDLYVVSLCISPLFTPLISCSEVNQSRTIV